MYGKSNEFTKTPWVELNKWYMKDESKMCREKFLDHTPDYFYKYESYRAEGDTLTGDSVEVFKHKKELKEKQDKEMNNYCK